MSRSRSSTHQIPKIMSGISLPNIFSGPLSENENDTPVTSIILSTNAVSAVLISGLFVNFEQENKNIVAKAVTAASPKLLWLFRTYRIFFVYSAPHSSYISARAMSIIESAAMPEAAKQMIYFNILLSLSAFTVSSLSA
jgi:hypothetical protein